VRLEHSPTPNTAYKTMDQMLKRNEGPGGHIQDEATHAMEGKSCHLSNEEV